VEERSERHRKDWFARAGSERKTRRLVPGASRETPEGDAEAGSEGWVKKREAQAERGRPSRRADSKAQAGESRARRFRPEESWPFERRRPQGGCRENRNKPQGRCRGVGLKAQAGETIPKAGRETRDTDRKVRARSQRFSWMALPEGRLKTRARGESRTPERESARGLAGRRQEMRARAARFEPESSAGRKAAGGLSGNEGRKPGAETQPEGKAGGSAARQS
jgi:hypothetical protein